MPKADPTIRTALEQEAKALGWPRLHAELATVDPVTAARLKPADAQRIGRALEVFRLTGQPLSSFHTSRAGSAQSASMADDRLLIALEPTDRGWLHQRIAQRFDAMLANGFINEVKALRARGDLRADLPAMRCVGYRQAWQYLDAHEARGLDGRAGLHALRDKGIFATRQLAKRQLTWLRAMSERQVVACDAPDALDRVLALVQVSIASKGDCGSRPAMTSGKAQP